MNILLSKRISFLLSAALLCWVRAPILLADSLPPTTAQPAYSDEVIPPASFGRAVHNVPPLVFSRSAGAHIDLLVAYTPDAHALLKKKARMFDEIKRLIYFANRTHLNSGTGVSFSLTHVHALTINSSDNFLTDLNAATNTDGTWDELQSLRETYKADMVVVLTGASEAGKLCGRAWLNGASAPMASSAATMYSIVSINPICSRVAFTHEIGHNMGSAHERANASDPGWQPFSYGYRFTGASGQVWQTVMAMPSDREMPFFSTPLITYDGVPIGVENSEDNVSSITMAASTIEALYTSLNGGDLALPALKEPNKITMTITRVPRSVKKIVKTTLRALKTSLFYEPIGLYWSQGKRGVLNLRAYGRTNSKGEYSFKETLSISKGIFYRSCYWGPAVKPLCSQPIEIAKKNNLVQGRSSQI